MLSLLWKVTFLFVQRGEDAVVSADFKVDLLLHTIRDGTLWDNDADSSLNGAQDTTIGVEDTSSRCNHCVALIFIVIIIQGTGAGKQRLLLSYLLILRRRELCIFFSQAVFVTSQEWPWVLH